MSNMAKRQNVKHKPNRSKMCVCLQIVKLHSCDPKTVVRGFNLEVADVSQTENDRAGRQTDASELLTIKHPSSLDVSQSLNDSP